MWVIFFDFLTDGGVLKVEASDIERFLLERRRTLEDVPFLGDLRGVETSLSCLSTMLESLLLVIIILFGFCKENN